MRSPLAHWCVVDVETAPDATAEPWLRPVKPDGRLKDPDKIAADVAEKREAQRLEMALDPYGCRLVAIGWMTEACLEPSVHLCQSVDEEAQAIRAVTEAIKRPLSVPRPVIGYNLARFDLPVLLTRARLLGVPLPPFDLRRWGSDSYVDLFHVITFDGLLDPREAAPVPRTLQTMARRFGVRPRTDEATTGAQIPELVRQAAWEAVRTHLLNDLVDTHGLAVTLGVLPLPPVN
jgi:hypothetical protein